MQYCIKVKLNSVQLFSSLSQSVKRSDVQGSTIICYFFCYDHKIFFVKERHF